jgi:2-methylcitrate dehydratase PrpD
MPGALTEIIASFVGRTGFEQIPVEGIALAKDALLDFLSVGIAGTQDRGFRIMMDYVRRLQAIPESTVICERFKTSADWAAFVNAMAAHATQSDASFPVSAGFALHPGAAIFPALLAISEKEQVSGKRMLTAYCVATEVLFRLGTAMGARNLKAGWHPTSVLGTLGAALACSSVAGLGAEEIRNTLGIASSLAGGLRRNFGTMAKDLHVGNAARSGILASTLAAAGLSSDDTILDGSDGFLDVFAKEIIGPPHLDDLGRNWNIVSSGLSFKPYPCSRGTHAAIEATLFLRQNVGVTEEKVGRIVCLTSGATRDVLKHHRPHTGKEAKFSMEYCIAVALREGKLVPRDFSDKAVQDPAIQRLMKLIDYPDSDQWPEGLNSPQEIIITLKDGNPLSRRVEAPKGEPENPMSHNEIVTKFRNYSASFISTDLIEQVIEMVNDVEELEVLSIADLLLL